MKPGVDVPVRYRAQPFTVSEVFLVECEECLAVVRIESLAEHMKRMHSGG